MVRNILVAALILLVAVFVVGGIVIRRLLDPEAVRAAIEQQATAALGQPVKVGGVDWAVSVRPRVVLNDVQIGSPAAIALRRVELTTGLHALFSKRVEQGGVVVSGSRIQLPLPFPLTVGDGAAPASSGSSAAALTIASIDRISLGDIVLAVGGKQLRLDVESSLAGDRLVVSRLRLRSDRTSIDGSGEFSSLAARRGAFTATADSLDLDELLTVFSGFSGPNAGRAVPAGGARPAAAGPATPLDLRLGLKAAKGQLLGIDLTSLVTTFAVTRDAIALEPFSVGVFSGSLTGRLHLDTKSEPARAALSAKAAQVDVARMAAFAGSAGVITGRLEGQIDLHADAGSPDVVFRSAGGRAAVAIVNGRIPHLDLVGPVVLAFGKPDASKPAERSDAFSRLGGTFTLANGVLRSVDLSMTSRDLDLKGHGSLRLAGAVVDVKADLLLSDALSAQAGRDLYRYTHEGSRVVLPAGISGSLASPSVSIDVALVLQRAARNTMEDELKKRLSRLIKH